MPTIKGNLMFVSSRAAQVSEVWVRAPQVRTHVEGVVTTGNDRFPVTGGEVSFTAVPGPAVLALISQGRAVDTIPILVGDASTQTLKQVVSAAKVTQGATRSELERLAAKAAELIDSSTENAQKAQDGATRAATAAGNAKKSEINAEDAARRASNSSTSANKSSVWVSQAEQRTKKSASDAAGSAESAKADADRAANIASSTSWSGDKLTVNGKTSPSLRGPKGEPGDVSKAQLDTAIASAITALTPAVFQVQDGSLTAVTPVSWTVWGIGRIYPPAGTYWVEASAGLQVEKRGTDTVGLSLPTAVTITDGDYLFLQNRQDGYSVRVTPA